MLADYTHADVTGVIQSITIIGHKWIVPESFLNEILLAAIWIILVSKY